VIRSGSYVLGEEVRGFEDEFARYCGARHCVGVGSGLDALTLALRGLEVGPGHEVIVPTNAHVAAWLAVSRVGASIVPVEPDESTFLLEADAAAAAVTERTRAVIPVHLYGAAADVSAFDELARRAGIAVVGDAAQAHGAFHGDRPVGSGSTVTAFSFYPTKNLGALGDGGVVVTDDESLAERVRILRNSGARENHIHALRGVSSRLDELQAAMLRVKLPHLDERNAHRLNLVRRYQAALGDVKAITLPRVPAGCRPAWHVFTVRTARRRELVDHLASRGIETRIFYPVPPHLTAAYSDHGWAQGSFPVAERLSETVVSLPLGEHLTEDHVDHVVDAIREFG
jgi:dTDP-3-amino-3,4,6-trideoxy-alpha-D-glucose transaminase